MIEFVLFLILCVIIFICIGVAKTASKIEDNIEQPTPRITKAPSLNELGLSLVVIKGTPKELGSMPTSQIANGPNRPLPTTNETIDELPGYNDNYWIPVESTQRKVSAHLRLKYQKTDFQIHERIFDVLSFSRGEKGYKIYGYCHNKHRNIALSSLGIIKAVDLDTNNKIDNIINYLEGRYRLSPEMALDSLFDNYDWAFYILIYLAATSGRIVKDERSIIAAFIKSLPSLNDIDDEWIIQTIRDAYRPGKREIRNWLKAAAAKGADLNLVINHVDQLSKLPKNENQEFKTFRNYLLKQIALKTSETVSKDPTLQITRPERIIPAISPGNDEFEA